MQNSKNSDKGQSWLQLPDGYLDKTPMFQFLLVCLIFPLWGAAASLNDILITQFKTVFTLNDTADRKSTRLNSSHVRTSRMPSSA